VQMQCGREALPEKHEWQQEHGKHRHGDSDIIENATKEDAKACSTVVQEHRDDAKPEELRGSSLEQTQASINHLQSTTSCAITERHHMHQLGTTTTRQEQIHSST
jgi:hypothetical protein